MLWTEDVRLPPGRRIRHDDQADVCVVGAGIAGLTTAYLLGREGRSVVLLDEGGIAGGTTTVTTAHLSNVVDAGYAEIERLHGRRGAQLAADSHSAAIDGIERILHDEAIACDFERLDGYLFAPPDQPAARLDADFQAAIRAGLTGATLLPRAPLEAFDSGPCVCFPRQAQFHPVKYLAGLADAFLRHGGRLYTHSRVDRIETAGAAVRITVRGHAVTSDAVVVATNASVNGLKPLPVRHTPYISYAIGLRIPRRSIRRALFWDTETPYHYIRIAPRQGAGDLLLVGGGDHEGLRAHDVSRRHRHLEIWTRSRFPVAEDVEYAWSGRVLEPVDRLAFIGRHPLERGEVYVTTGDAGMGLTHGTIAGLLIADLIAGRANPWASLYDPARPSATMRSELARIAG